MKLPRIATLCFCLGPTVSLAAQDGSVLGLAEANVLWLFLGGILVLFMQAGFAALEMGLMRAKNAVNIMMKNLVDCCVGVLSYWLLGWALMFYLGTQDFSRNIAIGWASGLTVSNGDFISLFFQSAFAATASTIVSGAVAERAKFAAYVVFSIIISGLIYPYLGSWTWGGGWLSQMGFHDFAGSTVVHSVGGWAALVGAAMLGPRLGKYVRNQQGKVSTVRAIPGHSMPLAALGAFFLFFGWFGFNAVSTADASSNLIGLIVMNTVLAACSGTASAMLLSRFIHGKPDASMSLNGLLAGLVAIETMVAKILKDLSIDGTAADTKGTALTAKSLVWNVTTKAKPKLTITLPDSSTLTKNRYVYIKFNTANVKDKASKVISGDATTAKIDGTKPTLAAVTLMEKSPKDSTAGTVAIEAGDKIKLKFSEQMDKATIGTAFSVVFNSGDAEGKVYKGATGDQSADLIATITFNKVPSSTNPSVFDSVTGVWSTDTTTDNTLTLTLPTKTSGGTPANSVAVHASTKAVIGAAAVDLAGNAGDTSHNGVAATGDFGVKPIIASITNTNGDSNTGKLGVRDSVVIVFSEAMDKVTLGTQFYLKAHHDASTVEIFYGSSADSTKLIAKMTSNSAPAATGTHLTFTSANNGAWSNSDKTLTITLATKTSGNPNGTAVTSYSAGKIGVGAKDVAGNAGDAGQTGVTPTNDF